MKGNLIIRRATVVTPIGKQAVKGAAMSQLQVVPNATVVVTDGIIRQVGQDVAVCNAEAYETIDAQGRILLPGFVDSHTHLVFGGYRPEEFRWRLNGDSYMSIMERGGGIDNSVNNDRRSQKRIRAR